MISSNMASVNETFHFPRPGLNQTEEAVQNVFTTNPFLLAYLYIFPCINLVGLLNNISFIIVAFKSSLFKLAPFNCIMVIIMADTSYLLVSTLPWIQSNFNIPIYNTVGLCQLINFSIVFFSTLSYCFGLTTACLHLIWIKAPKTDSQVPSVFFTRVALIGVTFLMVYMHAHICWLWEVSAETQFQCSIHFNNSASFSAYSTYQMSVAMLLMICLCAVTTATSYAQRKDRSLLSRKQNEHDVDHTRNDKGRPELSEKQKLDKLKHMNILWALSFLQMVFAVPCTAVVLVSLVRQTLPPLSCNVITGILLQLNFSLKPPALLMVSPYTKQAMKDTIRHIRTSRQEYV